MTTEVCPKCQATLDTGYRFCDQCGVELKVCPSCQGLGYQKRCTNDGTPLATRDRVSTGPNPVPPASGFMAPPIPAAVGATTVLPKPASGNIRLRGQNSSIDLVVDGSKTVGRREGEFKDVLGGFSQISRAHAKIFRGPNGNWMVEDLGSSNKTYVDNVEASPRNPLQLTPGSCVRFADVSFVVELL